MITYIARRILWIIPVLFVVSVITFTLMHCGPGWAVGPGEAAAGLGRRPAQPEYGLDQPLYVQYINWADGLRHRRPWAVAIGSRTGA